MDSGVRICSDCLERPVRRGGLQCPACYQRRYRSTPEGKRHHNDAVIRYNAAHPDKRREWLRHSRYGIECRSCSEPIGSEPTVDDLDAWLLGYHGQCFAELTRERSLSWKEQIRLETLRAEIKTQRRYLRQGAADLVRASRLVRGASPSPKRACRPDKTSRSS